MKRAQIITTLLITALSFGTVNADDKADVIQHVQNIKATSNVGSFGDIISKIFDTIGQIKPEFLDAAGGGKFVDGTDPLEAVYMDGNVGIGTINPGYPLHIDRTVINNTVGAYLDFSGSATEGNGVIIKGGGNSAGRYILDLSNNAAVSAMRVLANGNVGIGTTGPQAKLDVIGTIRAGTSANNTYNLTPAHGGLLLKSSGTQSRSSAVYQGDATGIGGGLNLASSHYGIELKTGVTPTTKLIVEDAGDVGIGITNPSQKLHVAGNSLVTGNTYIGSTDAYFYRDAANRIATPDNFYVQASSPATYLYSTTTFLGAGTGDTTQLRGNTFTWNQGIIEGNGNVGIGTTGPDTKLEITNGTLKFNQGGVRSYKNLAHYNASGTVTGTMKITMPKSWSSTMTRTVIKGYNYTGIGAWEVVIGGYNYGGGSWVNATAEIRGTAPFTQVRLANDGTKSILLLGNTSTAWNYPQIEVSEFNASLVAADGWGTGWTIAPITSEAGIIAINTPAIYTLSGDKITDNTIDSTEIQADSLTAADLAPNSVGTSEVANNTLTADDLAPNSVGASEVSDNSLTATDLATNSVGNAELIDTPTVTQLNLVAAEGNGIRFWSSDSYEIAMGSTAAYRYGPVTDYSIKSNMNNQAGRGFTWGVTGVTPTVGIEATTGNFQTAGTGNFGGTVTGATPTANDHLTTKAYVDSVSAAGGGADGVQAGTYFQVGGAGHAKYYCKQRLITTGGYATESNINQYKVCDIDNVCVDGSCAATPSTVKRAFVTSSGYTGAQVNGIAGANLICQSHADAAGLSGTYSAWISNDGTDPLNGATWSGGRANTTGWILVDGTTLVNNWTDLTDGSIDQALDLNEYGVLVNANVWSNTGTSGFRTSTSPTQHCNWWTGTTGYSGYYGRSASNNSYWTQYTTQVCTTSNRLYCFEQ